MRPADAPVISPYLTAVEAARYSRTGIKFIYGAIRRRQLRHLALSRGKLLTTREWIDQWLASRIVEVAR